jgi:PIN domain nuclease of toxin-antitoxin system
MRRYHPKYRNISSRRVKILIDSHIFLCWDQQLRRLSHPLRAAIADKANDIFVSAASIWELAIKRALGKLSFSRSIVDAVSRLGFDILPVFGIHAEHAGGLPRHHNDPFDRLIIAQAQLERMLLGTQDRLMRPYGVATLGLD